MKNIVLDSCVFAKTFVDENDSDKATRLIRECTEQEVKIIAPSIIEYELMQTAIKKKLLVDDILTLFEDMIFKIINIEVVDRSMWLKAGEIANTGHSKSGYPSLYDSVFHAMAIETGSLFITADKRHYEKAKGFGSISLLKDWEESIRIV